MNNQKKNIGDANIFNAMFRALKNQKALKALEVEPVSKNVRIDGKTCIVTGANSGLGKCIAIDLARRGGNVLLACRPGHPAIANTIKESSQSNTVELIEVDLSDLDSVHAFCDQLRDRETNIDIAVLNAGLATRNARRTAQGYEMMFGVHFLANRVIVERWLADGIVRPASETGTTPRIVFISSEAHRSKYSLDFDRFGEFTQFRSWDSLKYYGLSKLALTTYATELSRRLNPDPSPEVAVHALCPGTVSTNIAREAQAYIKPLVNPIMKILFLSPEKAIAPVIYLCCSEEAGTSTGLYLHMMQKKKASDTATDIANGRSLWETSIPLVKASYH